MGDYAVGTLAKDWQQVVATRVGVLFYKRDGSGALATFHGGTYALVTTYAAGELPTADLVTAVGN